MVVELLPVNRSQTVKNLGKENSLGFKGKKTSLHLCFVFLEVLVGGRSDSVHPHRNPPQRAGARRPIQLQTVHVQEPLHQGLAHPPPQVPVCFTPEICFSLLACV